MNSILERFTDKQLTCIPPIQTTNNSAITFDRNSSYRPAQQISHAQEIDLNFLRGPILRQKKNQKQHQNRHVSKLT